MNMSACNRVIVINCPGDLYNVDCDLLFLLQQYDKLSQFLI